MKIFKNSSVIFQYNFSYIHFVTIFSTFQVINNLMISHLEYRTEESEDVKSYVFKRNIITMVVPLGQKLQQIRNDYQKV